MGDTFPGTLFGRALANHVFQVWDKAVWARTVCGSDGFADTARQIGLGLKEFYSVVPEADIHALRAALIAHAGEALAGGQASERFGGTVSYSTHSSTSSELSFRVGTPDDYIELLDLKTVAAMTKLGATVLDALDELLRVRCPDGIQRDVNDRGER